MHLIVAAGHNTCAVLQATDLAVEVAARAVVKNGSFLLRDGDKVGLVGRNGTGKTSLLKVLSGDVSPAAGVVLRRGTLGYVPQDPRPDPNAGSRAPAPNPLFRPTCGRLLRRWLYPRPVPDARRCGPW